MKRFLCIWDKSIFETENMTECHYLDFFTVENGYTEDNIRIINSMDIGDVYSIPEHEDEHIIVRIID